MLNKNNTPIKARGNTPIQPLTLGETKYQHQLKKTQNLTNFMTNGQKYPSIGLFKYYVFTLLFSSSYSGYSRFLFSLTTLLKSATRQTTTARQTTAVAGWSKAAGIVSKGRDRRPVSRRARISAISWSFTVTTSFQVSSFPSPPLQLLLRFSHFFLFSFVNFD